MANSKISALTNGNPAQSGDEIPIARGGANYKITAGSIASLSGNGDVVGPASSTDSQIALFNSTTGKLIKAATTTGVLKASSGVIAAATSGTDYAPATTGTSAQLLANSGSGGFSNVTVGSGLTLSAGTLSASGGGLAWQSVQTTGFTAVASRAYPCNTTSAAFTVTLPASPSAGDQITLTDYAGTWGTNNLTVARNGSNINGTAANAVLSVNRGSVQLVYVDSTQGWLAYSSIGISNLFIPVEYLVVGAGGGGGRDLGGGGGAGGYRTGSLTATPGVSYTTTVGGGGTTAATNSDTGSQGGSSVFSSITSAGGGGGKSRSSGVGSSAGGSGGGAAYNNTTGGVGNTPNQTPAQGTSGGTSSSFGAGGGGGSSQAGQNSTTASGGNGGNGTLSSITGSTYAGGGGGGGYSASSGVGGTGGSGGGGNGTANDTTAANGSPNTGGGAGGGGSLSVGASGGTGGSGVVILKIPSTNTATFSAGVTASLSTAVAGYKIYTVTVAGVSDTVTFS